MPFEWSPFPPFLTPAWVFTGSRWSAARWACNRCACSPTRISGCCTTERYTTGATWVANTTSISIHNATGKSFFICTLALEPRPWQRCWMEFSPSASWIRRNGRSILEETCLECARCLLFLTRTLATVSTLHNTPCRGGE